MKYTEFEALKDDCVGHNLIKAARVYHEYSFDRAKAYFGWKDLRPSHLQLFAHIPIEGGITVKNLAEKANISKQAVSKMVSDLMREGVLIKKENEIDGRSFLVCINHSSKKGIQEGVLFLKKLDDQIKECIGDKEMQRLNKLLQKIVQEFSSKL